MKLNYFTYMDKKIIAEPRFQSGLQDRSFRHYKTQVAMQAQHAGTACRHSMQAQ